MDIKRDVQGISVVIPAYNEEKFLPNTISSVGLALRKLDLLQTASSEIIVVDNASTDNTAKVAAELGAKVIRHEVRNIASVRNAGIREARYDLVITVDADTFVPECAFQEIRSAMETGKYIGGGVRLTVQSSRYLLKLLISIIEKLVVATTGLSGGMFFFWKTDALEFGGFPESHFAAEDMAFARALRTEGLKKNLKFLNLRSVEIKTLDRKGATIKESLKAFYIGAKIFLGAKLDKRDLDYWYKPKR